MTSLNNFLDAFIRMHGLVLFMKMSFILEILRRMPARWTRADDLMAAETQRMSGWMLWINPYIVPETMKRKLRLVVLAQLGFAVMFILAVTACGQAGNIPQPVVIQTEGLTPTATPMMPTSTPSPVPPTLTPLPTPDIEATIAARVEVILSAVEPTATPQPIPTPIPPPTATRMPPARFEPVPIPSDAAPSILKLSSIGIANRQLHISGYIENQGYDPTSIQVWHSQEEISYSSTCSTDRPIAFIRPGNGSVIFAGQSSEYTWEFCKDGYSLGEITDRVPWLYSQGWSYQLRERKYIFDPYIYDFSVSASLDYEAVKQLEYDQDIAAGWRVVVFSGNRIILNQWVGG